MRFSEHIGKGIWAFADKALPAIYGLGVMVLVIRVLPEEEYGAFVIIQTLFTLVTVMGYALAFQPLTKYIAETATPGPYIGAGLLVNFLFLLVVSVGILVLQSPLSTIFDPKNQVNLAPLFIYLPIMLAGGYYRAFSVSLLQAKFKIKKIFWIDATYFLGTLVLIIAAQLIDRFHSAADVLTINVVTLFCSTIVAVFATRKEMSVTITLDRQIVGQMWRFGKYSFGGSTVYMIFSQMDVFFVTSFAGIVALAAFNAAKMFTRIFELPAQVLQMFLIPYSSREYARDNKTELVAVLEKAICFSTLLFLPVFLVLFLLPEQLLNLLYGGKYTHAAPILRILSLLALLMPWNAGAASYIVGIGKVKQGFFIGLGLIALAIPTYVLLTPTFGPLGTSYGLVGVFFVITIVMVRFVQRFVPITFIGVLRRVKDIRGFLLRYLPSNRRSS